MTEGSKKVLSYLQANYGKEFTKRELTELLDISINTVIGSINGLIKKGFASERIEYITAQNGSMIEYRYVTLTELGKQFDPEQEERRIAREKAVARAAAKAERIRIKAERARKNSVL